MTDVAEGARARVVADELASLRAKLAPDELVTCVEALVVIQLRATRVKTMVVQSQFPEAYPDEPLLFELKSKTLPEELLKRLAASWEQELKLGYKGEQQILALVGKARTLLFDNRLLAAWEEVRLIRDLVQAPDTLRIKDQAGVLRLGGKQGLYQMRVQLTVPETYPDAPVVIELLSSTFPESLQRMIMGQMQEISRLAIEGPLLRVQSKVAIATQKRRLSDYPPGQEPERLHARETRQAHEPEPSLLDLARFFIFSAVHRFPRERCPLCKTCIMPEDPAAYEEKRVVYLYCGHLYHYKCLDSFMRNPPFDQGKACAACGRDVYHDLWPDDIKLLEARWAHDQARRREMDDVSDFLGL